MFYQQFTIHEFDFFGITDEAIDCFSEMYWIFTRELRTTRQRKRSAVLISWQNKLLKTLIWLRSYPTFHHLSLIFDVSLTLVHKAIHEMWQILHQHFRTLITWPSIDKWESMRGCWSELEEAVGAIDGTSHRIYRPTENQALFYSGHRDIHCVHTQVIIDISNKMPYLKSGFLCHNNDAMTYRLIDSIGPNDILPFPCICFLLGDTIYPSEHPRVTPYTSRQLRNEDEGIREQRKQVNAKIRTRRVYVEHAIRQVNMNKVIGSLYRHQQNYIAPIVELCSALSLRRSIL